MHKQEAHQWLAGRLPAVQGGAGVTKEMIAAAAQGNEGLARLIDAYIPEERYPDLEAALTLIPEEGWQDLQSDHQ